MVREVKDQDEQRSFADAKARRIDKRETFKTADDGRSGRNTIMCDTRSEGGKKTKYYKL